MWIKYFNFIKLRRGRVIVPIHGEIDFSSDDIPIEICKELYEKGFPYLELTELGKNELYGIAKKPTLTKQQTQLKRKKLSMN
ncbi:MAG TPA: hypothetical protein DCR40_16815 [Prolixibacteraceae bacterium]|nr:hypothetical protein [Prolixibacteraceae bacterium]